MLENHLGNVPRIDRDILDHAFLPLVLSVSHCSSNYEVNPQFECLNLKSFMLPDWRWAYID